ncbi:hypothetical protein CBR_g19376 [Chara braunii]|uniref:Reverse transcriptase domain-containing protein n=1 Tax=Chara braunii TaxID=69332 RepID=A0A388KY39_CHABU|nr:hypothetical protein CBR_g19376 [Chara braunii]|eukprot:GBG74863.1 hypothetical protein CBR_g19376 [Chara braunii]
MSLEAVPEGISVRSYGGVDVWCYTVRLWTGDFDVAIYVEEGRDQGENFFRGWEAAVNDSRAARAGEIKKHKTVVEKVKPAAVSRDRMGETSILDEEIADIIRKRKETDGQRITTDRLAKMDIGDENLTEKEKEYVAMTLRSCDKAIAFDDSGRGRIDPRYAKPARIHTIPHVPWKDRPQWKYAQKEKEEIVAFIKEKIRTFVTEPCESAYSNKWFFLRKGGSNKLRWIQNLQRTNAVTIRDMGSVPEADLLAEGSAGCSVYSICDLFSGYDEIPLDYRDSHMTAMYTPLGLVQMMVVPKGWTNGVAVFQRAMIIVLKEFIPEKVEVFLDNFPIKGPVERDETEVFPGVRKFVVEHMKGVREVLAKLDDANLTVSGTRSHWGVSAIKILGFVYDKEGRRPDSAKLEKLMTWSSPLKSITEVRQFLGVVGYWRIFIKAYSEKAEPLRRLLRKAEGWTWGEEQTAAMKALKEEFREGGQVLGVPFFEDEENRPFVVVTDAGPCSVGEKVHIDVVTMLKGVGGLRYIINARDDLTGFVEAKAIKKKTTEEVSNFILEYIARKRKEREGREKVFFESVRRGKRSVRPKVSKVRTPLDRSTDAVSSSMVDITSEQWKAMLDAATENEKPFFQKLYEGAMHKEREGEAAAKATSIATQVALLEVPESGDDRFQEKLAAVVAALIRLRTLEDIESRVTAQEKRNQELHAEIVSLKQSQLSAPRPPNPRPAAVPVSHPSTIFMSRASGTVTSAETGASSSSDRVGSSALVLVPNAGTSAQNAAVLTGIQYNGPVVDKRAATLPSKYDGKGDITSWISSMRSYFEVLRTPQEDRSMIMGTNTEPGVRSFIELQAVTARYERIDLTKWLKVTPVRTLEDLLIAQYQDKHAALKARLKLEALKGQKWRTSMQALEQHLTGMFTTPNLGWTDVSCMDVVMGVAPEGYVSRLVPKDHTTWRELLTDLVNLEAKDLARPAKAPAAGRTSRCKRYESSNQLALHEHREVEDQSYADDLSLDDDLEPDSDMGCSTSAIESDINEEEKCNAFKKTASSKGPNRGSGRGTITHLPKNAKIPEKPEDASTKPWEALRINQKEWERKSKLRVCLHC